MLKITLSVNNRADVMVLPVTPASFKVSKPHSPDVYETVSGEELLLLNVPKLKSITLESFFPIEKHSSLPYLQNTDMWGWDYVNKIDDWVENKLPIRLHIENTPINMACQINGDFSYEVKTDGDLWYSLPLTEFNLQEQPVQTFEKEEELDMAAAEELLQKIENLSAIVNELAHPKIYNTLDEVPEWAKASVQKFIDGGIIQGSGGLSQLGLDYYSLRGIVIIDRAISGGVLEKEMT